MTGWTEAASCSNHYQHHQPQQHGAPSSSVTDPWMLNLRQYPYLYMKDGRDCDDASRHLVRFPPRCDVAAAAAAYEPPFVDCSHLFASHHHQRALPSTQDDNPHNGSTPDFQKDMWTSTDYQLNHTSQYKPILYLTICLCEKSAE